MAASNLLRTLAVAAALSLAPVGAQAVQLTCGSLNDAVNTGTETDRTLHQAYALGTVGSLGNLLCFVGDARCDCLRQITEFQNSLTAEQTDWANQVGMIAVRCRTTNPGRSLSGMSQEAAFRVCPEP